ncbi:DMT family transporter [Thalassotalea sediminis]|uniref:DMT family transporter n=1 Tax=Thalassotalea sediminis TaxID=1759089 RepID=UPI002572D0E5|nr:DMT family transporter [Thalassotalea sediminis]
MSEKQKIKHERTHDSLLSPLPLLLTTLLTLVAFAGNSVLCRLAIKEHYIDPTSYTNIRLVSGIIALFLMVLFSKRSITPSLNFTLSNWLAGLTLYVYAIALSYAYITVDTGVGAVVLFGAVQLTLVIFSFVTGRGISTLEWIGLLIAFTGFVYLMGSEIGQPSLIGLAIMALSGIAWGIYTHSGLNGNAPLLNTTSNFICTIPFIIASFFWVNDLIYYSSTGIILAVMSGAVTSGIGYALWYKVLPYFTGIQAGVVQLFVPIVAAIGGALFVNDPITIKLVIAAILILGGIALVTYGKRR